MVSSFFTTTPQTNGTVTTPNLPFAPVARFQSSTPGQITGVRYYIENTALVDGRVTLAEIRVFDSSGGEGDSWQVLSMRDVTVELNAITGTGWHEFALDAPVDTEANHTYGISFAFVTATATITIGVTHGLTYPQVRSNLTLEMTNFRDGGLYANYPVGSGGGDNFFADLVIDAAGPVLVDVGSDQTVFVGTPVDCVADAAGNGTLSYLWTKTSGPFGSFDDSESASTTFSPDGGDGTYVLRCTVTDDFGSALDEFTVDIVDPDKHSSPLSVLTGGGWTYVGGTDFAVLGDTDDSTYMRSMTNPVSQVLLLEMDSLDPPATGVDLRLRMTIDFVSGTSGSVVAKLFEGSTLRSTSSATALTEGDPVAAVQDVVEIAFPSADLNVITDWANLRLRLEATSV